MPEVAGVRVGARVQQQPGRGQDGALVDLRVVPGVGQVEQRRPAERAALAAGGGGVGGQDAPQRLGVGRRGGRVDAVPGDLGVLGEQTAPLGPAFRLVIFVVQAHQAEELIGQAGGAVARHAVGEAAVAARCTSTCRLRRAQLGKPYRRATTSCAACSGNGAGASGKCSATSASAPGSPARTARRRSLAWLRSCSKLGSSGRGRPRRATPFACLRSASSGRKEVWRPAAHVRSQAGSALSADRRPPAGLVQLNAGGPRDPQ